MDDTDLILKQLCDGEWSKGDNEFLGWLSDIPTLDAFHGNREQNVATLRDVLDNKKEFNKEVQSSNKLSVNFIEHIYTNALLLTVEDYISYYISPSVKLKVIAYLKKTKGMPYINYLYKTLAGHLPINIRFLHREVEQKPIIILVNDKHGQVLGIEILLREVTNTNFILQTISHLLKGILGIEPISVPEIYIVEDRTNLYNKKTTDIFAYRVYENINYFFLTYKETILITGTANDRYTSGLKVPNISDYIQFTSIGRYTGGKTKEASKG